MHVETDLVEFRHYSLAFLRIALDDVGTCTVYGRRKHNGEYSAAQNIGFWTDRDMRATMAGDSPLTLDFFATCRDGAAPPRISVWLEVLR